MYICAILQMLSHLKITALEWKCYVCLLKEKRLVSVRSSLLQVLLWSSFWANVIEDEELLHRDESVHVRVIHSEQVFLHLFGIYFWQSYLDKFSECFLIHATLGIFLQEVFTLASHSWRVNPTGDRNLTDNLICEDNFSTLVAHPSWFEEYSAYIFVSYEVYTSHLLT